MQGVPQEGAGNYFTSSLNRHLCDFSLLALEVERPLMLAGLTLACCNTAQTNESASTSMEQLIPRLLLRLPPRLALCP
jgi:hypothetical protein